MLDALSRSLNRNQMSDVRSEVVGAVAVAFIQGEIKLGATFPVPDLLSQACGITLTEALEVIAFLMGSLFLRQDCSGRLRIHPRATLSFEMKQQAFLFRSRQLVRQGTEWNMPTEGLRVLFERAAREIA